MHCLSLLKPFFFRLKSPQRYSGRQALSQMCCPMVAKIPFPGVCGAAAWPVSGIPGVLSVQCTPLMDGSPQRPEEGERIVERGLQRHSRGTCSFPTSSEAPAASLLAEGVRPWGADGPFGSFQVRGQVPPSLTHWVTSSFGQRPREKPRMLTCRAQMRAKALTAHTALCCILEASLPSAPSVVFISFHF